MTLPAMPKTGARPLGWEDPPGKKMATHSSILAWKIPRTEEPGGLQSMGSQRVGHDSATNTQVVHRIWKASRERPPRTISSYRNKMTGSPWFERTPPARLPVSNTQADC